MKRRIMTEHGLLAELSGTIEVAQRARISSECIIGYLFSLIVKETRRSGKGWSDLCGALRHCWQSTLPGRPAPGECECLRLTLVDVPRAAMNQADPHHPSCEHYRPPVTSEGAPA